MTDPRDDNDPALTESLDNLFARNEAAPLPGTGKWKPSPHTAALKSIMTGLLKLPGWKRIRKRHVGRFIIADLNGNPKRKPGGGYQMVSVAVKGDPDCELSWRPANRPGPPLSIAVEVKTGSGRLSEAQQEKKALLEEGGWFYIVAGSAAEAFAECMKIAECTARRAA
jgi:hypothetical protein